MIGRRLDRLSERCNATLTIASVIGREFELRQLAPLVDDISEDRLLEVLEEALAARVVEELTQTVGRYQFTHALIQETLSEELSTTRRVQLHARIGEALEILYGAGAETHAAELAFHFSEAATVLGPARLIRYSLVAGEQALSTYAYEEALDHFQLALAAKEGQETDQDTAESLFGLGRAHAGMFQRREALANLTLSFDYYAETGDVQRAVAVSQHPINPGLGRVRVTPLISRALTLVPPDSHEAGLLLSRYGSALGSELGDYGGAQEAFDRALVIARRDGDAGLEMRTLESAALVDTFHARYPECVAKCLQAIELALRANEPSAEVNIRCWAALSLSALGDLEGARPHAAVSLARAEELRDRSLLTTCLMMNDVVSRLGGDWAASRDFIDQALAMATQDARVLVTKATLEYEVGDFDQAELQLEQLLELMRRSVPGPTLEYSFSSVLIPIVARITGNLDRLDAGETAAEVILSSSTATPLLIRYARVGLALTATMRGDAATAAERYAALAPVSPFLLPGFSVASDHALGLLAQTIGKFDQAMAHFEDALAFCRKAGYRPELAWSCCDYADLLRERNGEGDRAKAVSLLDESLAISSELGMRPLMERVLSRREILGA